MLKNIHQIWLGNKRIPKHIKEYMQEIEKEHKEYNYFFWNDSNIPDMPKILRSVFDSLDHPAMKSDLLRVYVLYLHGGIYLDVDYKLLANIDNLKLDSKDDYIVYQRKSKVEDFNSCLYISNKKGKFVSYMLKTINEKKMWLGPHWYAKCIYDYLGLEKHCDYKDILKKCDENNIGYIDWDYFDSNIAKHTFMASWYPDSFWKKKFDEDSYE